MPACIVGRVERVHLQEGARAIDVGRRRVDGWTGQHGDVLVQGERWHARAVQSLQSGQTIRVIGRDGLTLLLVEHDVAFVTRLADAITVIDGGRVIAEGPPEQIRNDPAVIAAYLGQEQVAS